jgi:Dyp-type peroxidase family
MTTANDQAVEWHDVQGMVLRGYGELSQSANLLLQVDDATAARAWLAKACDRVTTADRAMAKGDECYLNVAFSKTGLKNLGLSREALATFPTSFFEGMSSPNRSRILGDALTSAPTQWTWGGPETPVDLIVLIFAKDRPTLDAAIKAEQDAMKGLSLNVPAVVTQLFVDQCEHFGFHDGISQPVIAGSPQHDQLASDPAKSIYADANVIKAGEFLLGYLNEYDVLPDQLELTPQADPDKLLATTTHQGASVPDLGRNGTYLVVRQVDQHVARLWNYLEIATKNAAGQSCADERNRLGAKMVGRWPSGAPVALSPQCDDSTLANENNFVYQPIDPEGFGCPFGSHIRRTNPRDTLGEDPVEAIKLTKRHRLLRRGRSYGPRAENLLDLNDTQSRGLMFMCINANIERQFEFVQQTWVNNPSFNGLYNERDPIFGDSSSAQTNSMTIPRQPVRRALHNLGGFITVRGGGYFFMPSISALRYLATMPPAGT